MCPFAEPCILEYMQRLSTILSRVAVLIMVSNPLLVRAADALAPVPLGALTAQLYKYSLRIAGLAVFLMFILAGLTYIVPALKTKLGDPVKIIKDAIIGLIILASAYVILNSINPDLVRSSVQ